MKLFTAVIDLFRPFFRLKLHWQILFAMLLGILIAVGARVTQTDASWLYPLGTVFIRLLKMVIVPLVLSSIIVGVAGVGDSKNLGRMGTKTLLYYFSTSLLAILIALAISNIIQPGKGVDLGAAQAKAYAPENLNKPGSLGDILIRMIPTNPVAAATEMDMLGIIFFAIVFGFALAQMKDEHKDKVLPFMDGLFHTMMNLTEGIIKLAPFGVLGLIAKATDLAMDDFDLIRAIGTYWISIVIGLSVHMFVVLPLIYMFFTKANPIAHFRNMASALLTAFSTSSSSATLPVTMECVETNSGVSNKISSFVLPMGATVNMDGTAIYECAGALFIAQVLGVELSFASQMTVVLTALLASIGAAGIPSAGLVMIFIVLEAIGLQGDTVNLIVGVMLAVDRPLDMYRTATNVFSDSVGTVIIAHSEGEIS